MWKYQRLYIQSTDPSIQKGDLNSAKEVLTEAIAFDEHSSVAYNNLGMVCLMQKDLNIAINYLEKALTLDSKILEAYQNLGSCYLYKQEYEKAEGNYINFIH